MALYKCRDPESETNWTSVDAYDEEYAAEKHAEYHFNECGGWEYMSDDGIDIEVKDTKGKIITFHVWVEFDPTFRASKKKALAKLKGEE